MSHTILHKLANGGVGSYPPEPKVMAVMMGAGYGWDEERIAWEAYKFTIPHVESGWLGFSDEFSYDWCLALGNGGLTETAVLDLFTRRIQLRRGYTVSAVIDKSDLPDEIKGDRTFRDAVVWDDTKPNKCRCDMPIARGIHMDRIRVVRNSELATKDITFMRAVEAGDTSAQSTIGAEKQTLRDIPQTFDLTTDTPEELKAKWPAELPARE